MPDSSPYQYELAPKVPLTEFLPLLEYEFTDAPGGMLSYVLFQVICRFCRHTNILRRTVDIHTERCVPNYLLEPPDDVDMIAVMRMAEIRSKACAPDYHRVTVHCGVSCCHCHDNVVFVRGNELVFDRPPGQALFRVEMSVQPRRGACDVDRVLLDYEHALLDGVRAGLFAQIGKPWSNITRAQASENAFRLACANAAVECMTHNQRGSFTRRRRKF